MKERFTDLTLYMMSSDVCVSEKKRCNKHLILFRLHFAGHDGINILKVILTRQNKCDSDLKCKGGVMVSML